MPRRTEPLDRGLVTIRDPALLKPGELSFIRNAIYLPGSQAIQRAKGRAAFGTATASALDVDGLRDITFDTGDHYIVAHVSTAYVTAAVGDTGTFGILASGVNDGTQLEAVHYRNRWFLFNGTVNSSTATGVTGVAGQILPSNKVVYLSSTAVGTVPSVRQHGMMAVEDSPATTSTASTFSQEVTGYYEYWTTEVAKFTQDSQEVSLESGFSGNPSTVFVSTTAASPVISMPKVNNPGFSTHWRVYRSPKKDKESDKKFPTGFMIAEAQIATSSAMAGFITDTSVTASASSLPASVNTAGQLFSDFSNASALFVSGAGYATATVQASISGFVKNQGAYTFNLGGFSGNIKGIEVEFAASASVNPMQVGIRIGKNRNAQGGYGPDLSGSPSPVRGVLGELYLRLNTATKGATVTATAGPQTIRVGSPTDRWMAPDVPPFVDSDFGPNFQIVLTTTYNGGTRTLAVDYVKLIVYHGATFDSTIQFPTVAYTFGDVVAQVMKNGPAFSASTGDFYEDCLVLNDVSNPALLRYSYPGDPDAFPPTYFLDFETQHNDRITCIKTVNSRLIVMLRESVYRVNYLPSERDASFDRGRAIEPISRDIGCINEMCACTFTMDGGQERLAFVGDQGLYVTDGYTVKQWSGNLDWRGDRDGVGIANTANSGYTPVSLVNDIENQQLVFVFRNLAAAFGGDYYTLNFQYDTLVEGMPRVSGFVTMRNSQSGGTAVPKSAWAIRRSTGITEMYFGYGASAGGVSATAAGAGQVWRETGRAIPSTNATMVYRTRRMYPQGMSMEWRLNEVYGYVGLQTNGSPTVTYLTENYKTDYAGTYSQSKIYTFSGSPPPKLHKVNFNQAAEGLLIQATVSGECDYAQEYLILDVENFGKEDSGV